MAHCAHPPLNPAPGADWYEALIACDQRIIRSKNQATLLADLCRDVVQASPLDTAWIGMRDVGSPHVWPQAHCGQTLSDLPRTTHSPVSLALRDNRAIWYQDGPNDPLMADFSAWISAHGWHSTAVLPLTTAGQPVGVLMLHTKAVNAFDATAQRLLGQLASNISAALDFFAQDAQQRQSDAKLRNMQALIQQFIDELPGTAYLKDSQLRLLMVNRNLGRVLGVDPQTLIGKTAHDIFPADFADVITDLDQQMLVDGGRRTVEETFNDRHLATSMFVMQDASGAQFLGGLSLDVTERYHAAELTTVLLQINELGGLLPEKEFLTRGLEMAEALTSSKIGFLHFVNADQETLELVTWTTAALKGCTAAYDSHYPVSQAGLWADGVRSKTPMIFNDYAGAAGKRGLPPGHAPLQRLISVPVIENGQVSMLLGVGNKAADYTDADVDTLSLIGNDLWRITQRARAERALHQQVAELVELNQRLSNVQLQLLQSEKMASIGQLAAGVAHEINNPIGFVKSNLGTLAQYTAQLLDLVKSYAALETQTDGPDAALCQSLRQRKADMDFEFLAADLPQLIEESREGVNRVSQIVLDLKNFSRASDNEWRWADLHEGLDSTINVVWNQLKYKVEIKREYGDLPQVFCVASQINQVLMNLLVNAEQAIATTGHISIRTGVAGESVWIEVQDDGCGMDAATQARIFEPFYTTKPAGLGTGLGLSIAAGIASRHKGHLELRSQPGVGSTFRLVLPTHAQADDAAPDKP